MFNDIKFFNDIFIMTIDYKWLDNCTDIILANSLFNDIMFLMICLKVLDYLIMWYIEIILLNDTCYHMSLSNMSNEIYELNRMFNGIKYIIMVLSLKYEAILCRKNGQL